MKRNIILAMAAVASCWPTANAYGSTGLLDQIVGNNADLQAEKLRIEGEALAAKTGNNLPDPEVEIEYMANPANSLELTVAETIEWPGVYAARGKAIGMRISAWDYLYESKKIDVRKEAMLAYYDLVNINRQLSRQTKVLEVVNAILEKLTDSGIGDEYSVLDKTRLKIEAFEVSATISELQIRKQVVIEGLEVLNGGKPIEGVDFDSTDYHAELKDLAFYVAAYGKSPEFKAQYQQSMADKQSIVVARREYLPNLTFGYKFTKEDSYNAHGFVFGISIPLFSSRHKAKAAKAAFTASTFAWQKLKMEGEGKIRILYTELQRLQQSIDEFQGIVDDKSVTDYLNQSLEAKAITVVDYLSEYKYLLEAQGRLDDMRYEFCIKYAELSKYDLAD